MNKNERMDAWAGLIGVVERYLEENHSPKTPVINYKPGKELSSLLDLKLEEKGTDLSGLMSSISEYLEYSQRTTHPQFNNQLYGGFHFEALMGEIVSFVANTSLSTYEVSPVASLIEKRLIEEINSLIGFKNGSGIMCTGGSNANLLAVHCARDRMFPEAKTKGNPNQELCIYVSKAAHYSFKKAANLLGMGMENVVPVEVDEEGVMRSEALESEIIRSIRDGKKPLMVASTAGTTVMGAFDPIIENDKIAKKYNLWHHVDGAWGGAVMFSDSKKHLIKGVEHVDSFTFDAHKMMATGLITSFFCVQDESALRSANSGGGSSYLFHEYENAEFDSGAYSLQCGRKVDSLKLWLLWKSKGSQGLEELVDAQFEKRDYFFNKIKSDPQFKLLHTPQHLNVCFQMIPENGANINKFNYDLRYKLVKEGQVMTNFSTFEDGTIFFRHVFANNQTQLSDIDRLIAVIKEGAATMQLLVEKADNSYQS